jgi:hypothetical protein
MSSLFRKKVIVGLALLLGVFPFNTTLAQSSAVKAALGSVQSKSSAPIETIESTRETLISILDLTTAEIKDVTSEDKLGLVVAGEDALLASAARVVSQQLTMYAGYIEILRGRILQEEQTLITLRSIATDFKIWRERVYEPAVRQAFSALLVLQGNEVLLTTQRRYEKVASDVKKLQLSRGISANVLLPYLEDAQKRIVNAGKYQDEARSLFSDDEAAFEKTSYTGVPGGPVALVLERGSQGDFSCLTSAASSNRGCQLVFRRAEGGYYSLKSFDGSPIVYEPSDISRITGTVIHAGLALPGDELIGIIYIKSVNVAPAKAGEEVEVKIADVPLLSANVADNLLPAVTVQSLIKKVIAEINTVYQKDFLVMAKLAKKIASQ